MSIRPPRHAQRLDAAHAMPQQLPAWRVARSITMIAACYFMPLSAADTNTSLLKSHAGDGLRREHRYGHAISATFGRHVDTTLTA